MPNSDMSINEWLVYGVDKGWVSLPKCATHDGIAGTPEEEDEWEKGYDPCQVVLRVWYDL